jgi:hypothetical protein
MIYLGKILTHILSKEARRQEGVRRTGKEKNRKEKRMGVWYRQEQKGEGVCAKV